MRLRNKNAIITGAASGFGEGIAKRFAEEGANIIVADINAENGRRVADNIENALFCEVDVANDNDVKEMIEFAVHKFGSLDILVNNAGIAQRNCPMTEVSEEIFDRIFAVNVKSIFLAACHAVPIMKKQGTGVIINTASTAAISPRPGLVWYNGSKGAVVTITKSMAVELAKDNIRVNALNPVIGETGLTIDFMGGVDTPEIREKFLATIPMGRMSTPLDVANAALFFASDESAFVTGVSIEVDGGRCV